MKLNASFNDISKRPNCIVVYNAVVAWVRLSDAREFSACLPIEFTAVYNDTADGRTMAADEFCCGMNNDISTKFNRTKQIRAWERIIDNERNSVLMSDSGYRFNIEHIALWISDRLGI
ncbi:hypothetical protein D3C78_1224170 [compost metagenome]